MYFTFACFSQNSNRVANAVRITNAIKIDGLLNDEAWNNAQTIESFTQYQPVFNVNPSQKTIVRIIYDDDAIYVGAMLYDTSPDSIMVQMGSRDNDLNADCFSISFDTYNTQQDAYNFAVWSSGVQSDSRTKDATYDAVWESAAKIGKDGWSCEMRIPYSALRFPSKDVQLWGFQITRSIRRYREFDQWALQPKDIANALMYWGKLEGIKDIKAPIRLSVTPYLSYFADHYPANISGKSNFSQTFNGGIDVKYGINDGFTLDLTLLPDFSEVQSDNKVKNLSPFEVTYPEQRPFFKEAVDLFQKGNMFYSRRIGRTPMFYNSVPSLLLSKEYIDANPAQAKLLNAVKVSGRTKKGLAVGFFNAITNNTYATIQDSITGASRRVLTEPLTNYNILVFDKAFKNNSTFYAVNTNVIRTKDFNQANCTASGLTLCDKSVTYSLGLVGGLTNVFSKDSTNKYINNQGTRYELSFAKIKGNFNFNLYRNFLSNTYNANDLGITTSNNSVSNGLSTTYNVYEPWWILRESHTSIIAKLPYNYTYKNTLGNIVIVRFTIVTLNYITFWIYDNITYSNTYDYWETRAKDRYFLRPPNQSITGGLSSDYRKPLTIDISYTYTDVPKFDNQAYSWSFSPRYKLGKKFSFSYGFSVSDQYNNYGYVYNDNVNLIFGKRNLNSIENSMSASYIIVNNMALGLSLRHYYTKGKYISYYNLQTNGKLEDNNSYTANNDFTYNTFNLYLSFGWVFAPGSNVSIVWKNQIDNTAIPIEYDYFENLNHTISSEQYNSLSLKVLYYLDYNYVRNKLRKAK